MSFSFFAEMMTPLVRATLVLSLVAVVVLVVRYLTPESSPRANRFAWSVALASGIIWGGIEIEYPSTEISPLAPDATIQAEFDPPQEDSQMDAMSKGTLTEDILDNRVGEPALVERDDRVQLDQRPHLNPFVAATPTRQITLWKFVGVIWAIGVVVCVARNVFRYWSLLRELRRAKLAEPAFQLQWDRAVTQVSGRSGIPMLVTDSLGPAVAWTRHGYRLIVPGQRWRLMSHRGRRSVLLHEAAHVLRHDIFWSLFARMVAIIHWFNPLAWLAASRFDATAESMCDAIAAGGTRRLEFAQALLSLGQPNQRPLVASSGGHPLAARIKRLIGVRPVSRKLPGLIHGITGGLCLSWREPAIGGCRATALARRHEHDRDKRKPADRFGYEFWRSDRQPWLHDGGRTQQLDSITRSTFLCLQPPKFSIADSHQVGRIWTLGTQAGDRIATARWLRPANGLCQSFSRTDRRDQWASASLGRAVRSAHWRWPAGNSQNGHLDRGNALGKVPGRWFARASDRRLRIGPTSPSESTCCNKKPKSNALQRSTHTVVRVPKTKRPTFHFWMTRRWLGPPLVAFRRFRRGTSSTA